MKIWGGQPGFERRRSRRGLCHGQWRGKGSAARARRTGTQGPVLLRTPGPLPLQRGRRAPASKRCRASLARVAGSPDWCGAKPRVIVSALPLKVILALLSRNLPRAPFGAFFFKVVSCLFAFSFTEPENGK